MQKTSRCQTEAWIYSLLKISQPEEPLRGWESHRDSVVCFVFGYKGDQRVTAEHISLGFQGWKKSLCLCVLPPVLLLGDNGSLLWLAGWSASLLVSAMLGGLWDFLFLMRILPISSWGLGRGVPESSCKHGEDRKVAGRALVFDITFVFCVRACSTYRVFVQGVNQKCIPENRSTIFSHFSLLL